MSLRDCQKLIERSEDKIKLVPACLRVAASAKAGNLDETGKRGSVTTPTTSQNFNYEINDQRRKDLLLQANFIFFHIFDTVKCIGD